MAARKRQNVADKKVTNVVRISTQAYDRIKLMRGKETLINFIDNAVDTLELLTSHNPIYIVGAETYTDIKEARGKAIMEAAKARKAELELPYIAVILGQDTGT